MCRFESTGAHVMLTIYAAKTGHLEWRSVTFLIFSPRKRRSTAVNTKSSWWKRATSPEERFKGIPTVASSQPEKRGSGTEAQRVRLPDSGPATRDPRPNFTRPEDRREAGECWSGPTALGSRRRRAGPLRRSA